MKKQKALGAYIFAGAFTEGVRKHFDVLAHLEDGDYGVPSARLNFPKLEIHTDYPTWPVSKFKGVPFIYGNPPCAAWSALNGKKTRAECTWQDDPRVDCTRKHFTLLEQLRPKVWVWESVYRAFTTGRPFIDHLAARAIEMGYAITHLCFDAQYVGGKHRRERYFFIAHKVEFDWSRVKFLEAPTAGEVLRSARNHPSCPDDKLYFELPKQHLKAYKHCGNGEALQAAWDRLNPPSKRKVRIASTGKKFFVGRPAFKNIVVNPDEVAPTVVGLNLIHYKAPRHLTMAEMKALCGYPPTWKLQEMRGGGRWDLYTRAVMPPIGEWLAGHVKYALDKSNRAKPKVEIVDLRKATLKIQEVK